MATVHLKLSSQYEGREEATSYRVEYWYNRHDRYWAVTVLDNFDREVETCTPGNRADLNAELEALARKYNTTDVKKV